MRVIFIPGYGEDPNIFDKIHPHISAEKVFVDNWKELGNEPRPGLNVLQYAGELVSLLNITKEDVVMGHSMGGWIAYHIKHLTGCRIVQISSWTDGRKVVRPINNRQLIYWLTKTGFIYNSFTKRVIVRKNYKGKPSEEVFSSVVENLIRRDKNNVVNQLRLIFNPVGQAVAVNPDLRIHARADTINRFPDHDTYEVPGDHFSLYTCSNDVCLPIFDLLRQS